MGIYFESQENKLTSASDLLVRRAIDVGPSQAKAFGTVQPSHSEARLTSALAEVQALTARVEKMEQTLAWRVRTALRLNPRKLIWWTLTCQLGERLRERQWRARHPAAPRDAYDCRNRDDYQTWIFQHDRLTTQSIAAIRRNIDAMPAKPLISLIMPVYDTSERLLTAAISSVRNQIYSNWELCIADDASTKDHIRPLLQKIAAEEPRLKIVFRSENGDISACSNSALELASGDFVALMDHDDLIAPTALYEVAAAVNARPNLKLIFSDEDHIDENDVRSTPYFKPDFSEDLLLGQNMISHFGVYDRKLVHRLGGFRLGLEGSQDHDLALRSIAAIAKEEIHHIPKVLYHWRHDSRNLSYSETQSDRCVAASRRAVSDYLAAKEPKAVVLPHPDIPSWNRVQRPIPIDAPLVSVIIPTKDRADLLSISARGILSQTDYQPLELIIIDNGSDQQETFELFDQLRRDKRVTILRHQRPFNYSEINNLAVHHAKGDILAFVNNDIEVLDAGWLAEMVSEIIRPGVGAVGAKLYYPDGRVQHGGVVVGLGGVAGHSFMMQPATSCGYFGLAALKRDVSAVTAACMLVKKSVFHAVGGFNEIDLPIAFNDVDLCLKIRKAGFQVIWTPFAELIHHESASRGNDNLPEKQERVDRECQYMLATWSAEIQRDPFYNPNFALNADWGSLAK